MDPLAKEKGFYDFAWGKQKKKSIHFPSFDKYLKRIDGEKARYCKYMYDKVNIYKKKKQEKKKDNHESEEEMKDDHESDENESTEEDDEMVKIYFYISIILLITF